MTDRADADRRFSDAYLAERVYEGGNDDDPSDHGGRTSRGITQREYDAWRKIRGLAARDVWLADESEIEAIYREQYWNVIRGDDMPAGVGMFVFDGAVNSGPGQAGKWLERSLAAVGLYDGIIDGGIGVMTMRGVLAHPDHDKLIADMAERRTAFLEAIVQRDATQGKYRNGWLARVANVTKRAEAIATGSIGPDPVQLPESPKASPHKVPDAPVAPETAVVVAGGGAVVAAANEALDKAGDQAPAIVATSGVLRWVLLAIIIVGAGIAVWSIFHARAKARIADGTRKTPLPRNADWDLPPVPIASMAAAIASPPLVAAAPAGS